MDIEKLKLAHIDCEQGLQRFANKEELYKKYIKKFISDTNFDEIATAYAEKNYDELLRTSHSLKGVSGTLSIMDVYQKSSAVVEAIRQSEYDKIDVLYENMKVAYDAACKVISEMED